MTIQEADIMFLVVQRDMIQIERDGCRDKLRRAERALEVIQQADGPVEARVRAKHMISCLERSLVTHERRLEFSRAKVRDLDWSQA